MLDSSEKASLDLVVRGGVVVTPFAELHLDLGVRDGRICALAEPGTLPTSSCEVRADGHYVLPGGIDTHTHVRWPVPGMPASLDNFHTGSMAAAIGGTTTIIDFVPTPDGVSHWEAANVRLGQAAGESVIDYTFHPILATADATALRDIGRLTEIGLSSFKIYTTSETPLDDSEIRTLFVAIAENGGLAGFHAENHQVIEHNRPAVGSHEGYATRRFPTSRPPSAESASIALVSHFAREIGAPVFIYHVSSLAAIRALTDARRSGTVAFGETCTHYLTFDDRVYERDDAWKFVITPPIRGKSDREALWTGLLDRQLNCVASDHCAYAVSHKVPYDRFDSMPPGSPGIAARMTHTWSQGVARGRLTPVQFTHVTATNAAKIFGLYPRKGAIEIGADADLVVLDPDQAWTWPALPGLDGLGSDYDPYASLVGSGLPITTISRGRVLVERGRIVDSAARGEFVRQNLQLGAAFD